MEIWDFVSAINETKRDFFKEDPVTSEKTYNPFIVNRAFSFYRDTVLHANELNKFHFIPKRQQFSFLINSIVKRKRWSKWHKKSPNTNDLDLIMSYYSYSKQKALNALSILSKKELEVIRGKMNKGGR